MSQKNVIYGGLYHIHFECDIRGPLSYPTGLYHILQWPNEYYKYTRLYKGCSNFINLNYTLNPLWNWHRTLLTAWWMHCLMVPDRAAPIPNRPLFRMFIATLKPSPSSVMMDGYHTCISATTVQPHWSGRLGTKSLYPDKGEIWISEVNTVEMSDLGILSCKLDNGSIHI